MFYPVGGRIRFLWNVNNPLQTTLHHIPEGRDLHIHGYEDVKAHMPDNVRNFMTLSDSIVEKFFLISSVVQEKANIISGFDICQRYNLLWEDRLFL
jgi:hypothetical protein